MENSDSREYAKYFEYRNVRPDDYEEYRLPGYFVERLPGEMDAAILDIGCGLGQTLLHLSSLGYTNLHGVDVSEEAVEHCRSRGLAVERIPGIVDFCRLSNRRYALVFMNHVLEHVEKSAIIDTVRHVREDLLSEGGSLIIAVPNAQSHTGCYWAYEDFTHETIFTAGSLVFVLRAAGFDSVEFLDPKGIASSGRLVKILRTILLALYSANVKFWNLVTSSSFHRPSPVIFTFDIKALAKKT